MGPRSVGFARARVMAGSCYAPSALKLGELRCLHSSIASVTYSRCCAEPCAIPVELLDVRSPVQHVNGSGARARAASTKRFFMEIEALIRRASNQVSVQDGSPSEGRRVATPRLSSPQRCCRSGRRGISTRRALSASEGASREGASTVRRVITPVGKADHPAAPSPGGRCSTARWDGGTTRLVQPGPQQKNPQLGVPGRKGGTH